MDTDTHYWLNRVAVKLHIVLMEGFNYHEAYCWIYDWDRSLTTPENLSNIVAEDKALTVFEVAGVIESHSRNNPYYDSQLKYSEGPFEGFFIKDGFQAHDPLFREYHRLRFIEAFNYDKFIQFCEEHSLNYKEDAVPATLEISSQVPTVHVGDTPYTLKTLQGGSPLDVIQAAYDHADIRFGFRELRQWTQKTFEAQKRFTDIFRKNEFSKGKVLSPFVTMTPTTFMLKKQALLSPAELAVIRKNSID